MRCPNCDETDYDNFECPSCHYREEFRRHWFYKMAKTPIQKQTAVRVLSETFESLQSSPNLPRQLEFAFD